MKMKNAVAIIGILLISMAVAGHAGVEEGRKLMESGISCNKLSDEQLESVGDYYMEQMHPGEAHEIMDRMMGGEGSESLRQVHTNMARRLYCNENVYVGYGMMHGGMMGYGGMGWGYNYGYWNFLNVLYVILLIGFIVLVYLWIAKLLKKKRMRRK